MLLIVPANIRAQGPRLNQYTLGEGLTFTGKNGYELNLRGYLQAGFESRTFTDSDLESFERFRMRRIRLRLSGDAAQEKVEYRLQLDLSGNSEVGDEASGALFDAWVAYNVTKYTSITFGQKVNPTDNRELTMGSQTLQLVERSRLTSAFASIRDFGIFIDSRYSLGGGHYLKPAIAITNGDGVNVYTDDHGGLKIGGRLDYIPFGLFNTFGQYRQADIVRELTPKLVIGGYYSINQGMSSRRGRGSGDILYFDDEFNESLPDYTKFGFDFLFKYKGFSAIGEFVTSSATVPTDITQRQRNDGSFSTTFEVEGEQDVENYVKGRMMLGQGYNIQMGYVFKSLWSIDARYTYLKADKNSFLNNGTFYNRPEYYTFGVTKYISRSYGFKIQGSVTYTKADPGSNDIYGNPITGNEVTLRLMTTFSF